MAVPYKTKDELLILLKENNLLTPKVQKAISQAQKSHENQKRDSGTPYLEEHIYPVTFSIAEKYQYDPRVETILIVALLHDAPEDDLSFTLDICEKEFGVEIVELIRPLVKAYKLKGLHLKEHQKYDFYRSFMANLNFSNDITKIVKLEERLNNMQSTLSLDHNKDKYLRFVNEVEEMFFPLAKEISMNYYYAFKREVKRLKNKF